MYKDYLQSPHWKETRKAKLDTASHCQICESENNLHIHHKRYEIGEKEARLSIKRGLSIEPGTILGRELSKDLMTLCASCHKLWHSYFGKRYLTHKKANQIRRLIRLGITPKQAFFVTKNNVLYTPIIKMANSRCSQ